MEEKRKNKKRKKKRCYKLGVLEGVCYLQNMVWSPTYIHIDTYTYIMFKMRNVHTTQSFFYFFYVIVLKLLQKSTAVWRIALYMAWYGTLPGAAWPAGRRSGPPPRALTRTSPGRGSRGTSRCRSCSWQSGWRPSGSSGGTPGRSSRTAADPPGPELMGDGVLLYPWYVV